MEWKRDEFMITDEREKVDLQAVCNLLAGSYWAAKRPGEVIERSIQNSLCFSLYRGEHQIGFGRAVTDGAVFTWLLDIIIDPGYRGQGLGKWLVGSMLEHPELKNTVQTLSTSDAHGLYEQFGFKRDGERFMFRFPG